MTPTTEKADLLEPQQQQRVREIGDAEQDQKRDHRPVSTGQPPSPVEYRCRLGFRKIARWFPNPGDEQHAEHSGNHSQVEHRADLVVEQFVSGQPEQRADDRAERIHGAVKPECATALRRLDAVDQQRVARRTAQSLAQSVHNPTGQYTGPGAGGRDDELAQRRHPVAARDQWAPGEPVAQRARHDLGE